MTDEAKKRKYDYINQYKREHLARFLLEVKPEEKETWKAKASEMGLSLTAFIRQAVSKFIAEE